MIERYYINVRDDSGNNPDFFEVSKDDFETLQGFRAGGSAIFLPQGYSAMLSGSGEFQQDGELHKYLQFRAVRLYAVIVPKPDALATITELSNPK